MTFEDYKPIPGVDWATNGAVPTSKKVTIAARRRSTSPTSRSSSPRQEERSVRQTRRSIRSSARTCRSSTPTFTTRRTRPNKATRSTATGWSSRGGEVGITDVKTYGPYRMPKRLYQYGVSDIGQAGQADRQRLPGGDHRHGRADRDADDHRRGLGLLLRRRRRCSSARSPRPATRPSPPSRTPPTSR